MREKRILILTESMRPFTDDWGSTQRVYNYSKKLIENGYDISIICRNKSDLNPGSYKLDNISVVSFDRPIDKLDRKNGLKHRIISFIKSLSFLNNLLRLWYRFLYSEPNQFRGRESKVWAKKRKKEIISFAKSYRPNVIVVSGPPFGLFYLSKSLKQLRAKLVLDYRDPWYFWYEKYSLAYRHEKSAVKQSDLIVASTKDLSEAIKQRFKVNVVPILNGFNFESWKNAKKSPKKEGLFIISYTGYVLVNNAPKFRNPATFLEACVKFLDTHYDVLVRIIGVGDEDLSSIPYRHERLFFEKPVPNGIALNYILDSDLLVALHTANDKSGKYIVCGKIYDYIKSGNRVLSIGNYALCNERLVRETSCGIHVKNNLDDILNAMESEYSRWKSKIKSAKKENDITMYSREYQNERFVKEINKMLGEKSDD